MENRRLRTTLLSFHLPSKLGVESVSRLGDRHIASSVAAMNPNNWLQLANRTAIVTGAGSGIGAAGAFCSLLLRMKERARSVGGLF